MTDLESLPEPILCDPRVEEGLIRLTKAAFLVSADCEVVDPETARIALCIALEDWFALVTMSLGEPGEPPVVVGDDEAVSDRLTSELLRSVNKAMTAAFREDYYEAVHGQVPREDYRKRFTHRAYPNSEPQ